jgi:hypothetical protein
MTIIPKTVAISFLVVTLISNAASGYLSSDLRFFRDLFPMAFVEKVPHQSLRALDHMAVTYVHCKWGDFLIIYISLSNHYLMTVYTQIAAAIAISAQYFPKQAMAMGVMTCAALLVGESLAPWPGNYRLTVVPDHLTVRAMDPIPLIFMLLFATLWISVPHTTKPTTSIICTRTSKTWILIYTHLMAAASLTSLSNPSGLYRSVLGQTKWSATPEACQTLLQRMAVFGALLQLVVAVSIAYMVFLHQQATACLYFGLVYWMVHLLYVQLHHPWNEYSSQMPIPDFRPNYVTLPPLLLATVALAGSFVSLHAEQALNEERIRQERRARVLENSKKAQ